MYDAMLREVAVMTLKLNQAEANSAAAAVRSAEGIRRAKQVVAAAELLIGLQRLK
jgi:hypothetical protein